ncbi:ASCH domain-containing protein [Halobacteriales archaeon QS_1_68_20]|nr:MAG: ASCH domain-containing protein [Halobacteriales archaeon QS_1_68_20]
MLFKEYHIPLIRSGSKTVTRREWDENYSGPNVGTVVAATTALFTSDEEADCYIRVLDTYEESLGEMTDEDAQKEGDYEDLEDFREGYERVYGEGAWDPEKVVTVVEFEYVGRERPTNQTTLKANRARVPVGPLLFGAACIVLLAVAVLIAWGVGA